MNKPWLVSQCGMLWTNGVRFETESEAIAQGADALQITDGGTFYVGCETPCEFSVDAARVLEQIVLDAEDFLDSDSIGNWPNDTKEEREELTAYLTACVKA